MLTNKFKQSLKGMGAAVALTAASMTPAFTAHANDENVRVASVDTERKWSVSAQSIFHTSENDEVGIAVKLGHDVKSLTIEQAKNHIENTCMGSIPAKAFVERDPTLVHTKMYFSFEGIESNTKYNADTMQKGCDKYSKLFTSKTVQRLARVSFNNE